MEPPTAADLGYCKHVFVKVRCRGVRGTGKGQG
jgi:hypothetical protein